MEYSKDISIIVPLFNEEESLGELFSWIRKVMEENGFSYEVIFVDDGSTDGSWKVITEIAGQNSNVRGISFRRNYGKSAALFHGFEAASGRVVFTMDADARVLKYKICRTVIRSDFRLNYDEAQDVIMANQTGETLSRENRNGGDTGGKASLKQALATLNTLAQKLRAERIANGALTIEQDEMRFRLDEKGHPTEIYFESPNEAHHLIEEFMLLANRTVAKAVGSGRPFVYRVHDLPNGEKLEEVKAFKRKMGSRVTQQTIDLLTIRAQAKAVYSTYNIGHYGLAFSHYTHFTSPIRRYPDLMVHRLVEKYILTGKPCSLTREELEDKCQHCSACEQEAAQAERDSIKLFQAIWMNDHIGEILPGHISGVTEFGFFVQLDESRCEGLVHISNIGFPGETWQYDEKNYRLVCAENHLSYTLGDPVTVKVTKCDINRALIDFELAKNA